MKKDKKRMARKLMSRAELKAGKSPYFSKNWIERGVAIKSRVERDQARAHERALKRKKLAKV